MLNRLQKRGQGTSSSPIVTRPASKSYKLVKTQAGATLVSNKTTTDMEVSRHPVRKQNEQKDDHRPRCTRCWNKGHVWTDCKAKTCSACKSSIEGFKFCTNYSTHAEKATRFVPKKLLDNNDDATKPSESSEAATAQQQINDLKRKLSAMQASITASEKRLKSEETKA